MGTIIKYNQNGTRRAHLQVKLSDNPKNKEILDYIESVENEYGQAALLHTALGLMANVKPKPKKQMVDILEILSRLIRGQSDMMELIGKFNSGAISAHELQNRTGVIHSKSMTVLEGASEFSSGFYMLDGDESGDEDE